MGPVQISELMSERNGKQCNACDGMGNVEIIIVHLICSTCSLDSVCSKMEKKGGLGCAMLGCRDAITVLQPSEVSLEVRM